MKKWSDVDATLREQVFASINLDIEEFKSEGDLQMAEALHAACEALEDLYLASLNDTAPLRRRRSK